MSNHKFTMGSLFDGSGGFPLGAQLSGIEPVWASEVEPYPIAVTKHHFPNMKHLGDVSKIHGGDIDPVDVVTFGSPCFPAGTMITTDKGCVPIEKITVGMRVLTHRGRCAPVLAIGSKMSNTIILKDEYGSTLECTRNHPIYSAKECVDGRTKKLLDLGKWTPAYRMIGLMWSKPIVGLSQCLDPCFDAHNWREVKSISTGRENIPVYNMTVAIDNSYVADGIVVHNCQDMSIAGKRAGLLHTAKGDDTTTRSGLFYDAIRIMKEMREATHGKYPSFAVWENVPGALTSAKGEDFRCVLEELLQIAEEGELPIPRPTNGKWFHAGEILADHCSIAWRILDAQYWGVPQRRKRIYLVADFAGQRAGKILFERESMRGYFAQGGEARQGTADDAAGGAGGSDRVKCLNPWDCQSKRQYTIDGAYTTLNAGQAQGGQAHGICYDAAFFMGGQGSKAGGIGYSEEVSPTLKSVLSGSNTVPDVVYPEIARNLAARHDSSPCADRGQNVVALDCRNLVGNQEISGTLQAKDEGGYSLNYVNPVVYDCRVIPLNEQVIMRHNKLGKGTGFGAGNIGDHAFTLQASHPHMIACDAQAVVYDCRGNGDGCTVPNLIHQTDLGDKTGALNCMHDQQAIIHKAKPPRKYIVRRLTPLECNRLQGFPDGWGDIPYKDDMSDEEYAFWTNVRNTHIAITGKSPKSFTKKSIINWYNKLHTDSAEYKMWGNGVAESCVTFVMSGIAEALAGKFDK